MAGTALKVTLANVWLTSAGISGSPLWPNTWFTARTPEIESAVRVAVHRLRRRLGALLREEVGRTVEHPGDVEEEIRYLLTVAARPS